MPIPKGFEDLVKLVMKVRPKKPATVEEMWDKWLRIVFMGGKRSEPEINFIINMLKSKGLLGMEYVKKTDGDDWQDAVKAVISERIVRIKDEEVLEMIKDFQKELFRVTASLKGSARYFVKNSMTPEKLQQALGTKEHTWEFINNIAEDEDVSNVKYTKIIIWLHSIGYGQDFCPPSWQTKKFVNDEIGPYYQFYEDEKYFMKKSEEFAEQIKKKIKGSTVSDVSSAIFYYIAFKSFLPTRSKEKKSFTPALLLKFMKTKKLTLPSISAKLGDFEERGDLIQNFGDFVHKNIK